MPFSWGFHISKIQGPGPKQLQFWSPANGWKWSSLAQGWVESRSPHGSFAWICWAFATIRRLSAQPTASPDVSQGFPRWHDICPTGSVWNHHFGVRIGICTNNSDDETKCCLHFFLEKLMKSWTRICKWTWKCYICQTKRMFQFSICNQDVPVLDTSIIHPPINPIHHHQTSLIFYPWWI